MKILASSFIGANNVLQDHLCKHGVFADETNRFTMCHGLQEVFEDAPFQFFVTSDKDRFRQ